MQIRLLRNNQILELRRHYVMNCDDNLAG